MTTLRVARGDLAGLDDLKVDSLALPLFAVRTQPQAAAGFADWRLSGRIARLILSGRFSGAKDEALLMPGQGRLGAHRIFLLGLGAPCGPHEVSFERAVEVLAEAGARRMAFGVPPGAQGGDEGQALTLVERFVGALGPRKAAFDEVVILDSDGGLAAHASALKAAAQQAGLQWGLAA